MGMGTGCKTCHPGGNPGPSFWGLSGALNTWAASGLCDLGFMVSGSSGFSPGVQLRTKALERQLLDAKLKQQQDHGKEEEQKVASPCSKTPNPKP